MKAISIDLLTRLCNIADAMVENRGVQISDAAIRQLTDEIGAARARLSDERNLVGYEASCLLECIAELAYARSDQDRSREERAQMYINCFRVFVRGDLNIAERARP